MVVDETDERVDLLMEPLAKAGYQLVARVTPEQDLFAQVVATRPDVIIVDMGSPSRDTLEQMRCINRDHPKPIVMFANDDDSAVDRRIDRVVASVEAFTDPRFGIDLFNAGYWWECHEALEARYTPVPFAR